MSMFHPLLATFPNPMRVADSADFDGTNDYMTRGAGLTGAADSKTGIFSCWVRLDGGNGAGMWFVCPSLSVGGSVALRGIRIARGLTDKLQIIGNNSSGAQLFNLISTGTYQSGSTWRHFLAAWNCSTGIALLYTNDAADGSTTPTDDSLDYTVADFGSGAQPDGTEKLNGCIADLYFAPGQFLDLTIVANRRKFISASGKPVHLGTTGALPTGSAPLVYQHLDDGETVANFATNRGTGGNFTITGTLDTGSTSPSD